jgi:RNase P/RNase MRP subunit p30
MYDIVKNDADSQESGFKRLYSMDSVSKKIIHAKNLSSAMKYSNQKALVMLETHDFDIGVIRKFAEKKKACFLIDLGQLVRTYGIRRSILISRLRTFLKQCNRFGAYYAFASFADEKELRNSDELIHIAMLLGINKGQARFALGMLPPYLG